MIKLELILDEINDCRSSQPSLGPACQTCAKLLFLISEIDIGKARLSLSEQIIENQRQVIERIEAAANLVEARRSLNGD